ncbi:hypothetical protein BDR03DRAFT_939192 [Suillus americanus]|nr:hypothetical protein BDR03DRAFT_939192 [Suillus americanus]
MLQRAVLDPPHTDPFAYGQQFMALSRVRCRRGIRTLFVREEEEKTDIAYCNI